MTVKLTVTLEVELLDLSAANTAVFSLRMGYGFPNRDVARDTKIIKYSVESVDDGD